MTWCLEGVKCPVFVVAAGKDNFFLPECALSIVPKLADVRYWVAEKAGHMVHTSSGPQAAEFFDRSLLFLESLNLHSVPVVSCKL